MINLHCANDTVLITESAEDFQILVTLINKDKSEEMRLKMDITKT